MREAKKQCSTIYPCWSFLVFPSSERLTSFLLLGNKKKSRVPSVNLIVCEHTCIVPWLSKKLILLKSSELLFFPLPKQQLSRIETRHFNTMCLQKDCYSIGSQGQLDLRQETFTAWEHKLHQFGMVQYEINVSMAAPGVSRASALPWAPALRSQSQFGR